MLKLVDKPMAKLGADGGKALKALIDASISKDNDYFKFHANLRYWLNGEHWKNIKSNKKKEQLKLVVNLAHAHVRSLVPTLYFQNPTLDALPTSPVHAGKEQTWNTVINNTIDKIGFCEEMKAVILDAVTYPEAAMKDVLNIVDEDTSEQARTGPTEWLSKGTPSHIRLNPTQLIVDYLSKDRSLENARFIAIRYRRPLAELRKNKNYKIKIDKVQSSPAATTGNLVGKAVDNDAFDDSVFQRDMNVNEQMATIYEVWIHQLVTEGGDDSIEAYQQMCVLMEGQDTPIRDLTPWSEIMGEGFNRYPVTRICLNPIPDDIPVAEVQTWQGLQVALNWLMSRITQLVENDRLLYLTDPSKIKNMQKFKEQFYSGRSRELVEVHEIAGAVEIAQPTFVGRDNYSLLQFVEKYIQQVSGLGQNRRAGSGIRTASEAHIIEAGTQIKTDEKVDTVSKFLIKVFNKTAMMIRHLAKQTSGDWVFRRNNDLGSIQWTMFTSEDINWLPEIRIRVNSFRKQDSLQDMQKFAGLLQSALAVSQIYGPQVRVDILFARMLEAAGIHDANKIVGDQDEQTKLQMVEISAMIAGVDTPVLESHAHPAHIQSIDSFMNSQIGMVIIEKFPEVADRLAQHREFHILKLQEQQQKAQQAKISEQNPWQAVDTEGGTVQSEANSATAGSRTAFAAVPGGQGEYQ